MFVLSSPSALVITVNSKIWKRLFDFDAFALGFIIFINNDEVSDNLLIHELTHIEQVKNSPFTQWYKYTFNPKERMRYEADAFARQLLFVLSTYTDVYDYSVFKNTKQFKLLLTEFTDLLTTNYKLRSSRAVCENAILIAIGKALVLRAENDFYKKPSYWIYDKK